jgi:hypothetical protein
MADGIALAAMRLVDMHRIHPSQDNSHVCSKCGERVGIYPTGQRVLKHNKGVKIICVVCAMKDYDEKPEERPTEVRPAGRWDEIAQESRDSKDVGKA